MKKYQYGDYELRPYQAEAYEAIGGFIRNLSKYNDVPKEQLIGSFIEASVGAGKTAIMGAVCSRFVEMGWPVLCLARDLKLVEQNAETFWDMKIKNSIYSAAYSKSMVYSKKGVIVSNEATAYRAVMGKSWDEYAPRAICVDENHQVGIDREDSQYMELLRELNRRCVEKYGHRIVLLGFTGSPYRHTMSIKGDFWRECLYVIDTATLVSMGFLVPTIFGAEVGRDDSLNYDLSKYGSKGEVGTSDFSKAELAKMEKEMIADGNKLKAICSEVERLTKDRNAVMITCAGVKHCKEVAKYLPPGSSAIVYSGQSKKTNDAELKRISNGNAKYLLQVGCLTTGYDEPCIDTSVILRRIGSLTLLVQLLGRGMRLLKPKHIEAGLSKDNHLVLDYSGTMDEMGEMYENPILDECRAKEDKAKERETQACPVCSTENSMVARRCVGYDNKGNRCEFFFNYITCDDRRAPNGQLMSKGCGVKNDPRARNCRCCGEWLNDPSESLNGTHYKDTDLIPVVGFKFGPTKAKDKLMAYYKLANGKNARELFDIAGKEQWKRGKWNSFVKAHVKDEIKRKALSACKNIDKAMEYAEFVLAPTKVTHRVNEKGFDLINRKVFE